MRGSAGFQSSHFWQLSLAVGTACFCVQLLVGVKRASYIHALQLSLTLYCWNESNYKVLTKKDCYLKVVLFLWDPFILGYLVHCN